MPFSIKHHKRYGLYSVRWTGKVTYDDVRAYYETIADYDWFRPGLNSLHDFREAQIDLFAYEFAAVTGLYSNIGDMFGPGRSVNIVTDRAGRHLASALGAARLSVSREIIAVEDLPSALEALGLPEDAGIEL